MATKLSLKQLTFSYRNAIGRIYPINTNSFFSKLIARLLQFFFPIFVTISNIRNYPARYFERENTRDKKFKPIKINFSENNIINLSQNGWCFIENFFDNDTYLSLLKYWPKMCFFDLSKKPIKYYRTGFFSVDRSEPKYIKKNPYFKYFYNFLFSEDSSIVISNLFSHKEKEKSLFINKSVLCSFASENSYLIPHIDGISKKNLSKKTFNFIYFLDGNNNFPEYSGATGIYLDNEFEKKVFVPDNLKNTCLVYDSSDTFFHGFKSIKKDGYRKAITFQYFHKDQI